MQGLLTFEPVVCYGVCVYVQINSQLMSKNSVDHNPLWRSRFVNLSQYSSHVVQERELKTLT